MIRQDVNSLVSSFSKILKFIEQTDSFVKTPTKKLKGIFMHINKRTIIKRASMLILFLIVILLLILGVQTSKFSDIKKYDSDKSPRDLMSQTRSSSSISNNYNMQVTIKNDTIANLGDFTFNIAGNKKLVANISLKYKPNTKDNNWFNNNSNDDVKKEILQKSVMLRDATISTMLGSSTATPNSDRMRKALKETLNNTLSTGRVEEVYFNKFIIQYYGSHENAQ